MKVSKPRDGRTQRQLIRPGFVKAAFALLPMALLGAVFLHASGSSDRPSARQPSATWSSYIVRLKDRVSDPLAVARRQADAHGAALTHVYTSAIKGYAATMSARAAEQISAFPTVAHVEGDQQMELLEPAVPSEPQEMENDTSNRRIFAADKDCEPSDNPRVNLQLDIDCRDDRRVDVDVAVLDDGVDDLADVNVFKRTDCTLDSEEPFGCKDGGGYSTVDSVPNGGHATGVARRIAELDNGRGKVSSGAGGVGIAAGARIWSVKVTTNGPVLSKPGRYADLELAMSQIIAGVDWVDSHAEEIEVANMSIGCKAPWAGPGEDPSPTVEDCDNGEALDEAIDATVKDGVVFAVAAGNSPTNTSYGVPQNDTKVINTSLVTDFDGTSGGLHADVECNSGESGPTMEQDDSSAGYVAFGPNVDVAAPRPCGGTSFAAPQVAAAAAILASRDNPDSEADVLAIRKTIEEQGNLGYVDDVEDPIDTEQEPLLDLSCESVFDPVTEKGEAAAGGSEPPPILATESDTDADCRPDLITLDSSGAADVFGGAASGFDTAHPGTSLELDPALLDDTGEYMVDAADVTGDGRADLVGVKAGGKISVYPGASDRSFGAAKTSLGITLSWNGGPYEPIAVADVTGDGHADFITAWSKGATNNQLIVFPGRSDGSFGGAGEGLKSSLSGQIDSALLDQKGDYFLDAADVNGDGKPDLVSLNTNGSAYVFAGKGDGSFNSPAKAATVDPITDDGKGAEPVGLGDVNGDGRADLLTLAGEALKLYEGKEDGTFAAPTEPYEGTIDSNLTDGAGSELIGLLDYNHDELADLTALGKEGELLTYEARVDPETGVAGFAAPLSQGGHITSTRRSASGQELVSEKPFLRRAGCTPSGCRWLSALCKASGGTCSPENQYAANTTVQMSSTNAYIATPVPPYTMKIKCAESSLEGKTTAKAATRLPLEISALTLTGCNHGCTTATAQNLPYAGHLGWLEGDNGRLEVTDGGKGSPAIHLQCAEIGGLDCTLSFEPQLDLQGGNPASLLATDEPLGIGGASCPLIDPTKFTATYTINSPKPLYVGAG
jgi:FG-GAP-like repeat/Subtilase family/Peptidase inhibitor I9